MVEALDFLPLIYADLRLINQKPLKHGGTEAAEETKTP
jgi:hypothetical protein